MLNYEFFVECLALMAESLETPFCGSLFLDRWLPVS